MSLLLVGVAAFIAGVVVTALFGARAKRDVLAEVAKLEGLTSRAKSVLSNDVHSSIAKIRSLL